MDHKNKNGFAASFRIKMVKNNQFVVYLLIQSIATNLYPLKMMYMIFTWIGKYRNTLSVFDKVLFVWKPVMKLGKVKGCILTT